MVTFALLQRVWELNRMPYVPRRASMAHVPTCQTRANFSFVRINVLINVPTFRRCANNSIWCANVPKRFQFVNFACQKAYQFFNYFSKGFFNYAQHLQTSRIFGLIQENVSREAKNLNFDICKISLRKNLLKSLTAFSMEHVRLNEQLFS